MLPERGRIGEVTQVGFAVEVRPGVALGMGEERGGVIDQPPRPGPVPHDAEAEGRGVHQNGTSSSEVSGPS